MKALWLTDIHLNFLSKEGVASFLQSLESENADCILIGGDIGEADNFDIYLKEFSDTLSIPIYFVLGNHDYYRGSIADVDKRAARLSEEDENLYLLDHQSVVKLTDNTALIGVGGWGDARYGDFNGSTVRLNDFRLIDELSGFLKAEQLPILQSLGDSAAEIIKESLSQAVKDYKKIVLLTHVPPFKDACWHEGQISAPDWLPFFSCKAVGDVIKDIMVNSDSELLILCGHTHGGGEAQILDNVKVVTGPSEYEKPVIQKAITII